jgi:hypothetical protein
MNEMDRGKIFWPKGTPGSKEAVINGCTCAILDNAHGKGFPWPGSEDPSFWINGECPVHSLGGPK